MARSWPVGHRTAQLNSGRSPVALKLPHSQGTEMACCRLPSVRMNCSQVGRGIATSSSGQFLKQQKIATLRGHVQGIRGVAFSPDGQLLTNGEKTVDISPWAHGGITGIKVWSVSSRREIVTVKGAGPVSPDGQLLAGRAKEGIRRWNVDALISC